MTDLRYAVRALMRSPGFSAAIILVLALGIGGSASIFTVLRGVLRPLASPHPEELVRLYERPAGTDARYPFSPLDYLDLAKENHAFASIAALRPGRLSASGPGGPRQILGARVTASFFTAVQVWPAAGRGFAPEDDVAASNPILVISNELCQREFGGSGCGDARLAPPASEVCAIGTFQHRSCWRYRGPLHSWG